MLLLLICESPSERDKIRHKKTHDRMINATNMISCQFRTYIHIFRAFSFAFFFIVVDDVVDWMVFFCWCCCCFFIVVIYCFWLFFLILFSDHFSFKHFSFHVLFIIKLTLFDFFVCLIVVVLFAFICLFACMCYVYNHSFFLCWCCCYSKIIIYTNTMKWKGEKKTFTSCKCIIRCACSMFIHRFSCNSYIYLIIFYVS